jgi:hypothetical protein
MLSREATLLRGRRLVRNCGCRWCGQRHQTRMGAQAGAPFAGRSGCLPLTQPSARRGEGEARRSRPRNSAVPPAGQSKRRADRGARAGGAVAPVSRVVRVRLQLGRRAAVACLFGRRCGSSDIALSPRGTRRLVVVLPARRAAGQSSRSRSGTVTHGSIVNCLVLARSARTTDVQSLCLCAASLVAFVPGVPQLGRAARPHAAGLAQGGLREAGLGSHGTARCSRAHSSSAA